MSSDFSPLEARKGVSKLIDTKLPLWALLGAICSGAWFMFALTAKVDRLAEDMAEVKVTLKTSIAQDNNTDRAIQVLQWRVDALEQKSGVVVQKR